MANAYNASSFLGLTFLYASEVAPLSVRVPITSVSTGTAWLFNFMVAEVSPVGFSSIGSRFYIVWAVLNLGLIFPCKRECPIWKFALLTNSYRRILFLPRFVLLIPIFDIPVAYYSNERLPLLETSGRSLEEVDEIFENTTSIFSAVRASKDLPRKHAVRHGIAVVEKEEGTPNPTEVLTVSGKNNGD